MVKRDGGFRETLSLRLSKTQMDALEAYERQLSKVDSEEYGICVAARHLLEQSLVISGELKEVTPLPKSVSPQKRIKKLEAKLARLKADVAVR